VFFVVKIQVIDNGEFMSLEFFKKLFSFNKTEDSIDYDFFKSVTLFSNLTNKEIRLLNDIFIPKLYKKNEVIFRENYPHVVTYIVKSGKIKQFLQLPYEEIHISSIEPRQHFGEIGLFVEADRHVSAIALEDSELIAIKKSDLKQFIMVHPATGIKLLYNFGKSVSLSLIETNKMLKQDESK
jgi:CRP-like cAMP-binding protein